MLGDLFGQTYNNYVETPINGTMDVPQSVFTNSQGTNLVVKNSSTLKLFVISPSGAAASPVTIESSVDAGNVTISGSNDVLYVCYTQSSVIRVNKSTDNGANWTSITNPGSTTNSEIVYYRDKLHLVYELSNSIYYQKYNPTNNSWAGLSTVSGSFTSTSPRIARNSLDSSILSGYVIFQKNSL